MHYGALYWSLYVLKSDLLEYTNENVNLGLPGPAASPQGTDRFHVLDLRLWLCKWWLCTGVQGRGKGPKELI